MDTLTDRTGLGIQCVTKNSSKSNNESNQKIFEYNKYSIHAIQDSFKKFAFEPEPQAGLS